MRCVSSNENAPAHLAHITQRTHVPEPGTALDTTVTVSVRGR